MSCRDTHDRSLAYIRCAATIGEVILASGYEVTMVDGLGNRRSPLVDVDRDGNDLVRGIGAGERNGSSASVRTGLYGVQVR